MSITFRTVFLIIAGAAIALRHIEESDFQTLFLAEKYNEIAARVCPIDPSCIESFEQLTAGPFPQLTAIGAGSYGAVYPTSDTEVIKVQSIESASHFSSLIREVNFGLRAVDTNTKHVVAVEGCCIGVVSNGQTERRRIFIKMKRYSGDLRKFMGDPLNRKVTFNPAWKYSIISDMVDGVAGIHSLGFVHRDLKPENILMDGSYEAAISDFGQIKPVDPRNPAENTREDTGTRGYIPLEGVLGASGYNSNLVSQAYDVYSLGVIIFEVMNAATFAFSDPGTISQTIESFCVSPRNYRSILNWEAIFYCQTVHGLVTDMVATAHFKRPSIGKVKERMRGLFSDFNEAQFELGKAKVTLEAVDLNNLAGTFVRHKANEDMDINYI